MPIENNKTYILSVRDRLNIIRRSYIIRGLYRQGAIRT
jgi:DNA-binding CsgD family transcriptional regulator